VTKGETRIVNICCWLSNR